jgi:hypothetical protein
MAFRLGVDVGGTFTDLLLIDESSGQTYMAKVPSTPGNIPTDDLIYLLDRSGVESGVSLEKIIETSRWLEEQLGRSVPALLPKAGIFPAANAQVASLPD